MSSRILDPAARIEPVAWRPHSSGSGQYGHQESSGRYSGDAGDHSGPESRGTISELEERIVMLEGGMEVERAAERERGFQMGIAAGAQQESAKWTRALERLSQTIEDMAKAKARFRAEVEDDAVKLALVMARKVLNREMATDPDALAGLARIALEKLNVRELQRVRVHPADAAAIERLLAASAGPRRVEVLGDGTLERGAALFETERGVLDASVTTQLGEIERGLTDLLEKAQ